MSDLSDYQFWDLAIKAGSAFIVIATGIIGVYKYFHTVEGGYRAPLWQKQLALYFEVTELIALIATCQDITKTDPATQRFWQIYYGSLPLVENSAVESAMVNIALELEKGVPSRRILKSLSLELAYECRNSISASWRTSLPELHVKYQRSKGNGA